MSQAMAQCFTAIAVLLVIPSVGANPVADPTYDLTEERVVVFLDRFRSVVRGTFVFTKTGFLFGDEERASKMTAAPEKRTLDRFRDGTFTVDVYFPVYAGKNWPVASDFHRTVGMSATLHLNRTKQKLMVRLASKADIAKTVKSILTPVRGCRPVWFKISLPKQLWPEAFSLEISYTQPGINVGKDLVFAYMPLLPTGKSAAQGKYRITVVPPDGKALAVLSTNRFVPTENEDGGLDFWPVDEEPILVAVAAEGRPPDEGD